MNIDELARQCVADSKRWFPDLHATDAGAAMHFFIGFVGEWGEYLDAMAEERAEELADATIYWLGLCATLGVSLDDTPAVGSLWSDEREVIKAIARIANKVKKWNRGDRKPNPATIAPACRFVFGCLLVEWRYVGDGMAEEIARKTAICEGRWGK